ncbi:MAG: hypothetical protein LBM66_07195 [Bifidobacteriaceae bacterium]|nr:hypothetical protein [Bifidobacteriaceae bacterium]
MLLAIPTSLGVDPAIGCHVITVLAGLGVLVEFRLIARRIDPTLPGRRWFTVLEVTLAVATAAFAQCGIGWPDLLLALLLLTALERMLRLVEHPALLVGLETGLVGGVAYWAKGPGFFVFPLMGLVLAVRERHRFRKLWRAYAAAIGGWVVAVVPLLAEFRHHYGHWVVSLSGTYNVRYMASPTGGTNFFMLPGLYPPLGGTSYGWSTPYAYDGDWSPFRSLFDFWYFLSHVTGKLASAGQLEAFGIGVLGGLAVLVAIVMGGKALKLSDVMRDAGAAAVAAVSALVAMQFATFQDSRYVWLAVPVGLLGVGMGVRAIRGRHSQVLQLVAVAVAGIATVAVASWPTTSITVDTSKDLAAVIDQIPEGSHIMGGVSEPTLPMYAAYYDHLKYYGLLWTAPSGSELAAMKHDNIEYVVLSDPSASLGAWTQSGYLIAVDAAHGVYRVDYTPGS